MYDKGASETWILKIRESQTIIFHPLKQYTQTPAILLHTSNPIYTYKNLLTHR